MTIEQLRAAKTWIAACLSDIHDTALARGADITDATERSTASALTEDEQTRWDAGTAEIERLNGLIARHEALERIAATQPANVLPGVPSGPIDRTGNPFDLSTVTGLSSASEMRDQALRAIEHVDGIEDRHRTQAEVLVRTMPPSVAQRVLTTGSPAYRSAFSKMVAGRGHMLDDAERQAVEAYERAQALAGADGGYAVPFTLDPTIIDTGSHSTNPVRQLARTVQITTNTWNGVSSAGVTAEWLAEATQAAETDATLAQPSIPTFKGSAFVPFSVEIGGDWAAIESDLRTMIGRAKDDLEGAAFTTGNGTTAPQGFVTALDGTASEIAPTTPETFAVADVYKVESALEARYRSNANWQAHKVWYNAIRQFDTAGGSALWERSGAGQPSQLLGYGAHENSDMDGVLPNAAATADNFGLVLGDWSNYVVVDRIGLNVELVPHLLGANGRPTGQRGFWAWWRVGGEVVNVKAFALLSIPTTA